MIWGVVLKKDREKAGEKKMENKRFQIQVGMSSLGKGSRNI